MDYTNLPIDYFKIWKCFKCDNFNPLDSIYLCNHCKQPNAYFVNNPHLAQLFLTLTTQHFAVNALSCSPSCPQDRVKKVSFHLQEEVEDSQEVHKIKCVWRCTRCTYEYLEPSRTCVFCNTEGSVVLVREGDQDQINGKKKKKKLKSMEASTHFQETLTAQNLNNTNGTVLNLLEIKNPELGDKVKIADKDWKESICFDYKEKMLDSNGISTPSKNSTYNTQPQFASSCSSSASTAPTPTHNTLSSSRSSSTFLTSSPRTNTLCISLNELGFSTNEDSTSRKYIKPGQRPLLVNSNQYCDICRLYFANRGNKWTHLKSNKHKLKVEIAKLKGKLPDDWNDEEIYFQSYAYRCEICGIGFCSESNKNVHLRTKKHRTMAEQARTTGVLPTNWFNEKSDKD